MGINTLYLLMTIFYSLSQGEKKYTKAGQKASRRNLKRFYKVDIQRSTYYYHRAQLASGGWIKTRARYKNKSDGTIQRFSDMITIKLKSAIRLATMRIPGAKELRDKYLNPKQPEDKRFPNRKDIDDGSWTPEKQAKQEKVDNLLASVTKELN